jgi:hypothetical protein
MVIANLHKNYSKLMLAGSGEFSHTEKRRENIALSKGSQDFAVGWWRPEVKFSAPPPRSLRLCGECI